MLIFIQKHTLWENPEEISCLVESTECVTEYFLTNRIHYVTAYIEIYFSIF